MRVRSVVAGVLGMAVLCGHGAAAAQERIFSPDSSVSIALPRSFQPLALNDNASLQFGDSASDAYVMVLRDDRTKLGDWNLARHSMIMVAQLLTSVGLPDVNGPLTLEIGGNPARQYEITGDAGDMRISYLHTTVESPDAYTQVVAWTTAPRWAENAGTLRSIVSSFQTHSPAASIDPFEIVPGTWAWDSEEQPCSSGRTQRFVIDEDGRTMQIHHSEPIEDEDGTTRTVTDYVIEGWTPLMLKTFIPNETRLTQAGDPVKWDLVVVGRNRIAWHRADWPAGALTRMLRRCAG